MNDRISKSELIVLPPIPAKRYFTMEEVSELCGVKPQVLRYWEQEFSLLKSLKRRGSRRYYQHHEVLLIRRIRELLYDHRFTIIGVRNKLDSLIVEAPHQATHDVVVQGCDFDMAAQQPIDRDMIRSELLAILALLKN